jgi:hypothetical protein
MRLSEWYHQCLAVVSQGILRGWLLMRQPGGSY